MTYFLFGVVYILFGLLFTLIEDRYRDFPLDEGYALESIFLWPIPFMRAQWGLLTKLNRGDK